MKFHVEDRMCLRKRRYPSEDIANKAIDRMKCNYPDASTITWKYYQCPVCRGFHIAKDKSVNPKVQKDRWLAGHSI